MDPDGTESALVFQNLIEEFPEKNGEEMKTKSKISGHIIRGVVYTMFLALAFIVASSAFDSPNKLYKSAVAIIGYGGLRKVRANPERSASQSA